MKHLALVLLCATTSSYATDLRKIEYSGHIYMVDKDCVIAVEPCNVASAPPKALSSSNLYWSKYQKKIIFLDPRSYRHDIQLGLANGNLTPVKSFGDSDPTPAVEPNPDRTQITLRAPAGTTFQMILDIPVTEVIDQLSKQKL